MTERHNPFIGDRLPPRTSKPPQSWLLLIAIVAITLVLVYRGGQDAHHEPAGSAHIIETPVVTAPSP